MVVVAAELIAVTVRLGENVVVVMSVQFEITSMSMVPAPAVMTRTMSEVVGSIMLLNSD